MSNVIGKYISFYLAKSNIKNALLANAIQICLLILNLGEDVSVSYAIGDFYE